MCLVEVWEMFFPLRVYCVFVWFTFKFLSTRLFPSLLSSSSSSPLPSSPLPSSPAHDTGSPTLQKVSGFSGEPALDLLTRPSSLQDFHGELPASRRLPLVLPLVSGFCGQLHLDPADHHYHDGMTTIHDDDDDDDDYRHHHHTIAPTTNVRMTLRPTPSPQRHQSPTTT